jgi:hypothetical protein
MMLKNEEKEYKKGFKLDKYRLDVLKADAAKYF